MNADTVPMRKKALSQPLVAPFNEADPCVTLAEHLHFFALPHLRMELEEFRIAYERQFGETDLTKRYTSTWPAEQQEWMLLNHPARYWAGLPAFVQAFLRSKMQAAHQAGRLDDMPGEFLSLYLRGAMKVGSE